MSDEREESDRRKKDKDRSKEKPLPVTPEASNQELCDWMEQLFDNEFPAKLTLVELIGRTPPLARGVQITEKSFVHGRDESKATEKPSKEFFVALSNRFIANAQRSCDSLQKPWRYAVEAYNTFKSADPYEHFPLFLHPKRFYVEDLKNKNAADDDEASDHKDRFGSDKLLRRQDQNDEAEKWRQEQFSNSVGGMFKFLENAAVRANDQVDKLMTQIDRLLSRNLESHLLLEKALSSQADRDLARDKQLFWLNQMKDGATMVRGILPQLVNKVAGTKVMQGPSMEGMVLKNFIDSCTKEQIELAFGKYTVATESTPAELVTPGVFTPQQAYVIEHVTIGDIDVANIDLLVPGSGSELAITIEQLNKAQQIFSQNQLMPLLTMFNERKKTAEKKK